MSMRATYQMLVLSLYPTTAWQPRALAWDLISWRISSHQASRVSGSSAKHETLNQTAIKYYWLIIFHWTLELRLNRTLVNVGISKEKITKHFHRKSETSIYIEQKRIDIKQFTLYFMNIHDSNGVLKQAKTNYQFVKQSDNEINEMTVWEFPPAFLKWTLYKHTFPLSSQCLPSVSHTHRKDTGERCIYQLLCIFYILAAVVRLKTKNTSFWLVG